MGFLDSDGYGLENMLVAREQALRNALIFVGVEEKDKKVTLLRVYRTSEGSRYGK